MKEYPNSRSPGSPPFSLADLSQPLRVALAQCTVIRVEVPGELPHWLSADVAQKRALVARGAPSARVWTVRELESLPWNKRPVTLGDCLQILGPTARPVAVT